MPEAPAFVFSGINHGPNLGEDVLLPGELPWPRWRPRCWGFQGWRSPLRAAGMTCWADTGRSSPGWWPGSAPWKDFPKNTLLNINIPADSVLTSYEGGQGRSPRLPLAFSESVAKTKDPWGRKVLWIEGGKITWTNDNDTDPQAARSRPGHISVTPLAARPDQSPAAAERFETGSWRVRFERRFRRRLPLTAGRGAAGEGRSPTCKPVVPRGR